MILRHRKHAENNQAVFVITITSAPFQQSFGVNGFLIQCSFGDFNFQLILLIFLSGAHGVIEIPAWESPHHRDLGGGS